MCEVLGVPRLVQQRRVVVLPAVRQDDQIDLVGYAYRRAERPRRLELADLGVEAHVGLRVEIDAQAREGVPERGHEAVCGEHVVEAGGTPQVGQIGVGELGERDTQALTGQTIHDALVEASRLAQKPLELGAQQTVVEALDLRVELHVVRVAELRGEIVAASPIALQQGIEMLLGGGQPGGLDTGPAGGVRLVALDDPGLAQADGVAVDLDLRRAFGVGDLVDEMLGLLAHEPVDGEGDEIREASLCLFFDGTLIQGLELVDGLAREQLGIEVVDAGRVAHGFAAREVLVVLAVEGADELLCSATVRLEVGHAH